MQSRRILRVVFRLAMVGVFLLGGPVVRETAVAQNGSLALYVEREIELGDIGLEGLGGLAYDPVADVFLVQTGGSDLLPGSMSLIDRLEHVVGVTRIPDNNLEPTTLAFNPITNSLYGYDPSAEALLQFQAGAPGELDPNGTILHPQALSGTGAGTITSMAFDPGSGRWFALDGTGRRLLILTPDAQNTYDAGAALLEQRLSRVDLKPLGSGELVGLAYAPSTGHLFTLARSPLAVYEFTQAGLPVASASLAGSGLVDPRALVMAPSGDHTDDPAEQSLYVADPARNLLVELAYDQPADNLGELSTAFTVVNTIQSSSWKPPSPDPVGLDVFPNGDLLISDSEVDELPLYDGANVFRARPGGDLLSTCTTLNFSKEPTGVAIHPADGSVFFSDDVQDRVFHIDAGPDGVYCTRDDSRRQINAATYGVTDPEGVAFGAGRLILSEGLGKEIVVVEPGNNGRFDGAPPAGDDTFTHFDTQSMGLRDPEGVGYHPGRNSLFIVSRNDSILVETTLDGDVLTTYNLRAVRPVSPGGVGVGPGSQNPEEVVVYVSDRGVDNNNNPNENDGKIYELSIGDTTAPPPTSTPTPPPTPTPTTVPPTPTFTSVPPTSTPTATPTRQPEPTEVIPSGDHLLFFPLLVQSGL